MIKYKKRRKYKYTLHKDYRYNTGLHPEKIIYTRYIHLSFEGYLTIIAGYSWDGPSGPAIDTKTFMRASLVHDVFYQLIREGHLPMSRRKDADKLMYKICREDDMMKPRAWWVYQAVRKFGKSSAMPDILTAP